VTLRKTRRTAGVVRIAGVRRLSATHAWLVDRLAAEEIVEPAGRSRSRHRPYGRPNAVALVSVLFSRFAQGF